MLLLAGGVIVRQLSQRSIDGDAGNAPITSPLRGPCNGNEITLMRALGDAPYPVLIPEASLASDSSLQTTWACDDFGAIALKYRSGIVIYERLNDLKEPKQTYGDLAKEYPEYSVGTSHGQVASLADPAAGVGVTGGVDFVLGKGRYVVAGNEEIPLEDLISVAESLHPAQDAATDSTAE